jgi:2-methylcitrate dehydratase
MAGVGSDAVWHSEAVIAAIADFVVTPAAWPAPTLDTTRLCLVDALGCAIGAVGDPDCARLLSPLFSPGPGWEMVPVPGTAWRLDPVTAAFDMGCAIRWLDFSDTSFVGGHPSDNLGAILAAACYGSRARQRQGLPPLTLRDVQDAMIKAYEIQGRLAQANRFDHPAVGLDHVIGVKIASTAVATHLLGGDAQAIRRALSNAFLDGQALNAYRHTPNAGTRKGWAGGDACARAIWLALRTLQGEMGYPQPMSAPVWGFEAVHLGGRPVALAQPLGHGVMDGVIFKLSPCQRNASTALESAAMLRPWLADRLDDIATIRIFTHDEAMRRINKTGPLTTRAARDHSLQYIVAIALMRGAVHSEDYSDESASHPRIDALREKMEIIEDPAYTAGHHDPAIVSCANAVQIVLRSGETSDRIETLYPMGDPTRRAECLPRLIEKFAGLTAKYWSEPQRTQVLAGLSHQSAMVSTNVEDWLDGLAADPDSPTGWPFAIV